MLAILIHHKRSIECSIGILPDKQYNERRFSHTRHTVIATRPKGLEKQKMIPINRILFLAHLPNLSQIHQI
jgi:hypothetical protein